MTYVSIHHRPRGSLATDGVSSFPTNKEANRFIWDFVQTKYLGQFCWVKPHKPGQFRIYYHDYADTIIEKWRD